jgi:hypothetical protein
MLKHLAPVWDWIVTLAIGLSPAALGALVAVSYERGLTWADRFTQFAVGVVRVSASRSAWSPSNRPRALSQARPTRWVRSRRT